MKFVKIKPKEASKCVNAPVFSVTTNAVINEDLDQWEKALKSESLYQIIPSSRKEAEKASQNKQAGKIIALWNGGWDIANISSDTGCSEETAALIITSRNMYPEFFQKKEEEDVDAF